MIGVVGLKVVLGRMFLQMEQMLAHSGLGIRTAQSTACKSGTL